jgi:hypothetical protein
MTTKTKLSFFRALKTKILRHRHFSSLIGFRVAATLPRNSGRVDSRLVGEGERSVTGLQVGSFLKNLHEFSRVCTQESLRRLFRVLSENTSDLSFNVIFVKLFLH